MRQYFTGQIIVIAALTIIAKVGAFLRDVLLSQTFGAGLQTDAFFIANAIPGLIFGGIFSTISLVFLPLYVRESSDDADTGSQVIITAFFFYLGLAAGLSLFTIVFAAPLTAMIAPQATAETKALATVLTRILALGFVFTSWVGLLNAIQQAHKAFIWPVAVPVYNHAAVIVGILIAAFTGGSVTIVAIAATVGWALQSPLQWMFARKFSQLRTNRKVGMQGALTRKLLWLSIPVFISVSLDQINTILDLFLGTGFGEGAASHLTYAFRLTILIGGIFALPISFFVFPYLSDAMKVSNVQQTQILLTRGIGLILALNMPMMVYGYAQADNLVSLLFQRGEFGMQDSENTAAAFQLYVIGTLFMGLREVFNRVFMAEQNASLLIGFSTVAFAINLFSSMYFQRTMGLSGIALGTTLGAILFVVLQVIYLQRKRPDFLSIHTLGISGICIVGCAAMLAALPIFHRLVATTDEWQIIWDLAVLGSLYLGTLTALAKLYAKVFGVKLWKL